MYSRDDKGQIVVLLAQEAALPNYRGSEQWSGFEGGVKGEESELSCATREISEESLALFGQHEQTRARSNDYTMKIEMMIHHRAGAKLRTAWVYEIPYDSTLPKRFAQRRAQLLKLKKLLNTCAELARQNPTPLPGRSSPRGMVVQRIQLQQNYLTYYDDLGSSSVDVTQAQQDLVQRHSAARQMAQALPTNLQVAVDWSRLTIKPDYLEKQRIAYFSASYLRNVLTLCGRSLRKSVLRLRNSFGPMLRVFLLNFAACLTPAPGEDVSVC
jgi:hypothetical protein